MERPLQDIPTVSIRSLAGGATRDESVRVLGAALEDIGFCYIADHNVSLADLVELYYRSKQFFELPAETKRQYARPDILYQRGWIPPDTERAAGSDKRNSKENIFFGPESMTDSDYSFLIKTFPTHYAPNIWPREVPELQQAVLRLYDQLLACGKAVCLGIGEYLKAQLKDFAVLIHNGPHVLRSLYYPAMTRDMIGNVVWGREHTDINFLTILPPSSLRGFMIRRRDGVWIEGSAPPGCVIAQVGDELQYITGEMLVSARHRVDAPKKESPARMSAAFFVHIRSSARLSLLESCKKRCQYPNRYRAVMANDFITERLNELFLTTTHHPERGNHES